MPDTQQEIDNSFTAVNAVGWNHWCDMATSRIQWNRRAGKVSSHYNVYGPTERAKAKCCCNDLYWEHQTYIILRLERVTIPWHWNGSTFWRARNPNRNVVAIISISRFLSSLFLSLFLLLFFFLPLLRLLHLDTSQKLATAQQSIRSCTYWSSHSRRYTMLSIEKESGFFLFVCSLYCISHIWYTCIHTRTVHTYVDSHMVILALFSLGTPYEISWKVTRWQMTGPE